MIPIKRMTEIMDVLPGSRRTKERHGEQKYAQGQISADRSTKMHH